MGNGMNRDEIEQYVKAASLALALPVAPAHLPGVMLNFERLAGIAAAVNEFLLGPEDEPGPRWEP